MVAIKNVIIDDHNVWKRNEGRQLNISYTIEHTGKDEQIEEIYFSNIHKETFSNLQQALQYVNYLQKQGYNNITMGLNIDNKEGERIIEDYANDIDIMINNEYINRLNKQNKEQTKYIERLEKEIEMYKAFFKKYNVNKVWAEFEEQYRKENNLY
jgi:hypothetical protein